MINAEQHLYVISLTSLEAGYRRGYLDARSQQIRETWKGCEKEEADSSSRTENGDFPPVDTHHLYEEGCLCKRMKLNSSHNTLPLKKASRSVLSLSSNKRGR